MDWITLGEWSIHLAFGLCCVGVLFVAWGMLRGDHRAVEAAGGFVFGVTFLIAVASAALVHGFLTFDYSVAYIAHYSERALDIPYKLAGLWAGPTGSLLFWCLLLSLYASAVVVIERRNLRDRFVPPMIAVLLGCLSFFLALITFDDLAFNPFERIAGWLPGYAPPDGRGLNPQLHNYWMLIHPVMLYLGYTGLTVPFAYAMGVLIAGERGDAWVRRVRFWVILPWTFLTIGVVLGGVWAYEELGWGGYWAWDPVENASFLPWLTSTAFVHSIMIQERRGMFRRWNMILIVMTFALCTLGTYITRGDVVPTVHNFGASKVQEPYQWFLGFVVTWGALLILYRWHRLKGDHRLDDLLSREGGFLFNNVVFLFLTVVVLFGTLHPRLDEIGTNLKIYPALNQVVDGLNRWGGAEGGEPLISRFPEGDEKTVWKEVHYNRWTPPLFVFLLFLTGAGPLLAWRKSSARSLVRNFLWPALAGIMGLGGFAVWHLMREKVPPGPDNLLDLVLVALTVAFGAFCCGSIVQEFVRGTRARRRQRGESWPRALLLLVLFNRRRYGGYVVHFGVVLMFMGVAFSQNYRAVNKSTAVAEGGDFVTGGYHLRLASVNEVTVERATADTGAVLGQYLLFVPHGLLLLGLAAALLARWRLLRRAVPAMGVLALGVGLALAAVAEGGAERETPAAPAAGGDHAGHDHAGGDHAGGAGAATPGFEPHYRATRFQLLVRRHDHDAWEAVRAAAAGEPRATLAAEYWSAPGVESFTTEWRRYLQVLNNQSGEPTETSEPAIRRSVSDDLYVYAPLFRLEGGRYVFHSYVNTLINWLWGGGIVVVLGMLVCLSPDPRGRVGLKGG